MYLWVTVNAAIVVATHDSPHMKFPTWRTVEIAALAIAMAIFMMSLLGLPPSPGFWGKLSLFMAAVDKGLIWLALIAVVNSVISLYYYVNVLRNIYVLPGETTKFKVPVLVTSVVVLTLAITILMGAFPELLLELSRRLPFDRSRRINKRY
jgi:NADH:ubiquinone oxidoreductase subunit 2 (subunit N)